MVTLVVKDSGEHRVIALTYENLFKEIRNIPEAEIIVEKNWVDAIDKVKTKFVCFVEADCLVNSGYFESLYGFIKKNPRMGHLGILGSTTSVTNWANRFYGYKLGDNYSKGIIPNKEKKSTRAPFYTTQIAYLPGAMIRTKMLREVAKDIDLKNSWEDDLVYFSTMVSLGFWRKGLMVYIAPNSSYCTTEEYVNDIGQFDAEAKDLADKFAKESI